MTIKPILIAGPTASGKSALALRLARERHGAIINADSMQVYRELRVLTARPCAGDEASVPHRLYGHVPAGEAYSVGSYVREAASAIEAAGAAGLTPIVVGGTGLYFKALLEGLSPIPDVPADIRSHWRSEAERIGSGALHAVLMARDPVTAARLRPSDPQRLVRALEVLDATGKSLSCWQKLPGTPVVDPEQAEKLVVQPPLGVVRERCDARFDQMMLAGALEEVRGLAALGLDPAMPAMRALGVAPLLAHLDGQISLEAAVEQAKRQTRHYVKRQITWLNRRMLAWKSISEI